MVKRKQKEDKPKYPEKVYSKKHRKYGYKWMPADKEWIVPPIYEEGRDAWMGLSVWVKRDGKYGMVNLASGKEEIPCEYTYPPYFSKDGLAIVWKDYKAGVINRSNEVVVPFVYDVLNNRFRVEEGGFIGYQGMDDPICLNRKGERIEFTPEEKERLAYDWIKEEHPDYSGKTIAEIEVEIVELYKEWRYTKSDKQEDKLIDLLNIRATLLNRTWKHTAENVKRIKRVNDLMMRAVKRAMRLGQRTAQSLDWMRKTSNNGYSVCVYVYPYWQHRLSKWSETPVERVKRQVLIDEEWNDSEYHIWNINVEMEHSGDREDGKGVCFTHTASSSDSSDWNWKAKVMDDGQSWDEGIHYPAYQDVYFLHPWHLLYWDNYHFALEDIAQMNDFRIGIRVTFETKESDKQIFIK